MIDKNELVRYIEATRNFKNFEGTKDRYQIGTTAIALTDNSALINHHGLPIYLRYKDISLVRGRSYSKVIHGKTYSYDGIILYIGNYSELLITARG